MARRTGFIISFCSSAHFNITFLLPDFLLIKTKEILSSLATFHVCHRNPAATIIFFCAKVGFFGCFILFLLSVNYFSLHWSLRKLWLCIYKNQCRCSFFALLILFCFFQRTFSFTFLCC